MSVITLLGEPKSTSHIYLYTCRGKFASMYMSQKGKEIKESYKWQAFNQWKSKPLIGNLKIRVTAYFGTKRKCDIDNFNKLVLDSLTGIVWEDDSQIYEMTITKDYDKDNPRVEIAIVQLSTYLLDVTYRQVIIIIMVKKEKNPAAVALGSIKSKKKSESSKENGKKGGRPKKKQLINLSRIHNEKRKENC